MLVGVGLSEIRKSSNLQVQKRDQISGELYVPALVHRLFQKTYLLRQLQHRRGVAGRSEIVRDKNHQWSTAAAIATATATVVRSGR